jgi:hypothetical protein
VVTAAKNVVPIWFLKEKKIAKILNSYLFYKKSKKRSESGKGIKEVPF